MDAVPYWSTVPNTKALPITAFERCGRVFLCAVDTRTDTVYAVTMKTFKEGDRVRHTLHGEATVRHYDERLKLVEIVPDGGKGWAVHPTSLTLVTEEPKFMVRTMFTNGVEVNAGSKNREQVNTYLTNLSDWDTVESITVNRLRG